MSLVCQGVWLQGNTEQEKLRIIQRIMRRGRLARRMIIEESADD